MELGRMQFLEIVKMTSFGAYLNNKKNKNEEAVLLPKKQLNENAKAGDMVEVFVYRDSKDRMIATVNKPKILMDELKVLKVAEVTEIGAFLDWGLEKDLFLPFKEQTVKVKKGDRVLVSLYLDKSDRICSTMNVYNQLRTDSPYKENDKVKAMVISINKDIGAFVAIDEQFQGLIPIHELHSEIKYGDIVEARVTKVKEDGKLDISLRDKKYMQMDKDAELIYAKLSRKGGFLPYNDKSSPESIKKEFDLSKSAFKTAVGRLLKAKKICFIKDGIQKL